MYRRGELGVLAISRDLWGLLGTLTPLVFGSLALHAGARARWGWCELEIADVAITVVDGFGWRIRRTARIDRPTPGCRSPWWSSTTAAATCRRRTG